MGAARMRRALDRVSVLPRLPARLPIESGIPMNRTDYSGVGYRLYSPTVAYPSGCRVALPSRGNAKGRPGPARMRCAASDLPLLPERVAIEGGITITRAWVGSSLERTRCAFDEVPELPRLPERVAIEGGITMNRVAYLGLGMGSPARLSHARAVAEWRCHLAEMRRVGRARRL